MNSLSADSPEVQELFEFLRFRSVSTLPECAPQMAGCAEWLRDKLAAIGLAAKVFPTDGHPIVLANSTRDPSKRTVLIYGHYDVQPPDPLEEWSTPPFEPALREGRIFARGATDNKGQIFSHIAGVRAMLEKRGSLPVNIIFLIEGEEEIGGSHLPEFLKTHAEQLRADIALISDTGMAAHMHPTLAYALRGVAALECRVLGPSLDLHSGVYGGAVQNPITAAARLLASLHEDSGRVAIPGFYDAVRPLEDWERVEAARSPGDENSVIEETGVSELFGEPGFTSKERVGARPTAEPNGFGGGYQGPGTKTVIPREAFFKLTFRLVPDQKADDILDLAEAHLRRNCPPGVTLEISRGHSGEAFFTDPNSAMALAARRAMQRVFGRPPSLVREGGSIPVLLEFQKILGLDSLLLALASPDCRAHSPDENFPLENFAAGIALCQATLEEIASVDYLGDVPKSAVERNRPTC